MPSNTLFLLFEMESVYMPSKKAESYISLSVLMGFAYIKFLIGRKTLVLMV